MTTLSIQKGTVNDIQVAVNNTEVTIGGSANLNVQVTPTPTQEIVINRGLVGPTGPQGPQGPSGNANIGGYPVNITAAQNYDALMFISNEWVNVTQLEIADGGNF